jgi:hypothetical protein
MLKRMRRGYTVQRYRDLIGKIRATMPDISLTTDIIVGHPGESDEEFVPLNDGWNWKGDPNATLSGQDIPHLPAAEYNPADGSYVGSDGTLYTQTDLAPASKSQSWQDMVLPDGGSR